MKQNKLDKLYTQEFGDFVVKISNKLASFVVIRETR